MDNLFSKKTGKLRTKYLKIINNIYIWSSINIAALKNAKENNNFLTQQHYSVASSKKIKSVNRSREEILKLIDNALNCEYYYSIFSYSVAQFEAFLFDIIKEILLDDIRKIKITVSGINFCKNIDINEVIDSSNKEEIINTIINKNLASLFYAAPKQQLEYLNKIAGISELEELFNNWIEIKATRDLIIHNQGFVNQVYLEKSGNKARQVLNKKIPIDDVYFKQTLANIKSLIGKITSKIQKNCKKD